MFDQRSRYRRMPTYEVELEQGRTARAIRLPLPARPRPAGEHRLRPAERLDHLAARFLEEATGFWRICDASNAMWPDDLVVTGARVVVPVKEL